jgi:16S rRNA processing protein RimM
LTDLILVGRIARAHGNRGQVIVNVETDSPEARFAAGTVLVVEQHGRTVERRIAAVRFQQGRPIVALEGVETMNDAEALAGAELKVAAASLPPLPGDTYYRHDLVGCEVKDASGRVIGRVTDVQGTLERSLLVVGEWRDELMIPMVEGIVVQADIVARVIVVELPEGLIGLNSALRESD